MKREPRELLGKRVRVLLGYKVRQRALEPGMPFYNEEYDYDRPVVATGVLLAFGQDGEFELLQTDGMVHYCWPMLDIEEL